jgi:hypothetical protein
MALYPATMRPCRLFTFAQTSVVVASLSLASVSRAQSDENRAAARAAATQGVAAEEAGQWAEAIELFTRAESLVHAPPHLLHVARAQMKRGKLVAAQEAYLKVTREELSSTAPRAFVEAHAAANEELAALTPRIPALKIVLEGGKGNVTLDGKPVADALVGIEFPIDPGKHEVHAHGARSKSAPVAVEVAEGAHAVAKVRLEPSAEDAPTAGNTPSDANIEPSRGTSKVPAYAALGVGAVGLAVGTVMMLVNRGKRDDADALCPSGQCPQSKRSDIEDLDASADSAATLSLVGYGVGVVGIGAGVVLLLLNGSGKKEAPATAWVRGGKLGLAGRF